MDPLEVARAYSTIAQLQPPSGDNHLSLVGERVLVRSVDPRQFTLLDRLCCSQFGTPKWAIVRDKVREQQQTREALFSWVQELDKDFRKQPADFIFPDPCSLLLWIWTVQLFGDTYIRGLGFNWKKYLYRGESRDYGNTAFRPTIDRPQISLMWRQISVSSRIRAAIVERLRSSGEDSTTEDAISAAHLAETMSSAQCLAVGQHYGCPTALLDITADPEIAMYFATLSSSADVGYVGFCDAGLLAVEASISLISVPPIFSRIHMQSGFFICEDAGKDRSNSLFQRLRFAHQPDVQPLIPGLAFSQNPSDHRNQAGVFEDPLNLESAFSSLPETGLPISPVNPRIMEQFGHTHWLRRAMYDLIGGAGRFGMTAEGRRFSEMNARLLYSLTRHAPEHAYIYTATLTALVAASEEPDSMWALWDQMIRLYRAQLFIALEDDLGPETQAFLDNLDALSVLKLVATIVGASTSSPLTVST